MIPPRDFLDHGGVASAAPEMDPDDPGGSLCDCCFHFRWIEIVGVWINIDEDWSNALPLKGVSRCNESETGNNDFALKAKRTRGDLKGSRSVAGCDDVTDAEKICDAVFELLNVASSVGEPAAVENIVYPFEEGRSVANVWATDVE